MRKYLNWSTIAIILMMSFHVWSEDSCSTKNVFDKYSDDSERSKEMKNFFSEPRNQDGFGSCYAFAAADLLSMEADLPLSAMHVTAIMEAEKVRQGRPVGAGDDLRVSNEKLGSWLCTESEFPTNANIETPKSKHVTNTLEIIEELNQMSRHSSRERLCNEVRERGIDWFRNLDSVEIADTIQANSKAHYMETIVHLAKQNCRNQIPIKKIKMAYSFEPANKIRGASSAKFAMEYLDKGLEKGKMVAIKYDIEPLFGRNLISPHASTITGRRRVNGKCMYVLRNSWGSAPCGLKQPTTDIICGNRAGMKEVPYGSMLVSKDLLQKSLSESCYVDN